MAQGGTQRAAKTDRPRVHVDTVHEHSVLPVASRIRPQMTPSLRRLLPSKSHINPSSSVSLHVVITTATSPQSALQVA